MIKDTLQPADGSPPPLPNRLKVPITVETPEKIQKASQDRELELWIFAAGFAHTDPRLSHFLIDTFPTHLHSYTPEDIEADKKTSTFRHALYRTPPYLRTRRFWHTDPDAPKGGKITAINRPLSEATLGPVEYDLSLDPHEVVKRFKMRLTTGTEVLLPTTYRFHYDMDCTTRFPNQDRCLLNSTVLQFVIFTASLEATRHSTQLELVPRCYSRLERLWSLEAIDYLSRQSERYEDSVNRAQVLFARSILNPFEGGLPGTGHKS